MSTFTPGPWTWNMRGHEFISIDGPEFQSVLMAEQYAGSSWIEVSKEDAFLIAAAPDLLEALMEFVTPFDGIEVVQGGLIGKARAAIAKATGQ